MPKITINGQIYEAAKGKTIIQAADDVGMEIPRYCYHPDIGIEGSCRMCLVEVKGTPKLMPACATPVADNMEVRTDTQRVHEAVRYAMEFLLLHHPIDCPVCDQSGECWLQDYYMATVRRVLASRLLYGSCRPRQPLSFGPENPPPKCIQPRTACKARSGTVHPLHEMRTFYAERNQDQRNS